MKLAFLLFPALLFAASIHEERVVVQGRQFVVQFNVLDDFPNAWLNRTSPKQAKQWESQVEVFEILPTGLRKNIGSGLGKWSTSKKLKDDPHIWVNRNIGQPIKSK